MLLKRSRRVTPQDEGAKYGTMGGQFNEDVFIDGYVATTTTRAAVAWMDDIASNGLFKAVAGMIALSPVTGMETLLYVTTSAYDPACSRLGVLMA
jgi:hypothetical protein